MNAFKISAFQTKHVSAVAAHQKSLLPGIAKPAALHLLKNEGCKLKRSLTSSTHHAPLLHAAQLILYFYLPPPSGLPIELLDLRNIADPGNTM